MKKLCPDLSAMTDDALRQFWRDHSPEQLKRLSDRLLAESLPRFAPRPESFYAADLVQQRVARNLSLQDMATRLGVNPAILTAWESGAVRPPASLALIYARP
jgi:DNA-binding transcriptional regulator YiaG